MTHKQQQMQQQLQQQLNTQSSPRLEQPPPATNKETTTTNNNNYTSSNMMMMMTVKEHEVSLANEQRHCELLLQEERAEWKEELARLQVEKDQVAQRLENSKNKLVEWEEERAKLQKERADERAEWEKERAKGQKEQEKEWKTLQKEKSHVEHRLEASKKSIATTAASHEKTIAAWKEKYDSGMKRERAKTAKKVQKEKDLLKEFKAELKRKKRSSYEAFQMTGPGAYRATATATTATDNDPNDDTTDRDTAGSPSASEQQPARKRASISKNYRKQDNVHDLRWNQRLEELQKFREQHGHCLVPWRPRDNGTEPANKLLAQWVSGQRTEYRWLREGKPTRMSPERIQLLNSIGFQWQVGPEQNTFEFRMVQLATFQGQQGHCNVPQKLAEPAGLGEFVLRVRRLYRQGKLPQERVEALEALGFQWSLRNRGGTLEARMQQQQPPTLQQPQPQHPPPAVEVQNNNNGDSSPY